MRYYYTGKLSENMVETPEGYLLCLGVPIGRAGAQEYTAEELPGITPSENGVILVERSAEEVFKPESMASFEGKSVTLGHPDEDVDPSNWKELTHGTAMSIRRGDGDSADLLQADLLITDAKAIQDVREGLREISCGYDAQYEELAPGKARQHKIIGNHIALVPSGRCGERCKIKDQKMKKTTWKERFFGLKKTMDEVAAEMQADEEGKKPDDPKKDAQTQTATDSEERIAALEGKLDEILLLMREKSTGDKEAEGEGGADPDKEKKPDAAKTGDGKTRDTRTADSDTVIRARLIAPHIQARVGDSMCAVKKASLRSAVQDEALKGVISSCLGGSTPDSPDCLTLDAAFVAASEVAKINNNKKTADAVTNATARTTDFGKAITPEEINKKNREFFGGK